MTPIPARSEKEEKEMRLEVKRDGVPEDPTRTRVGGKQRARHTRPANHDVACLDIPLHPHLDQAASADFLPPTWRPYIRINFRKYRVMAPHFSGPVYGRPGMHRLRILSADVPTMNKPSASKKLLADTGLTRNGRGQNERWRLCMFEKYCRSACAARYISLAAAVNFHEHAFSEDSSVCRYRHFESQ